jgi:hypothetical protein
MELNKSLLLLILLQYRDGNGKKEVPLYQKRKNQLKNVLKPAVDMSRFLRDKINEQNAESEQQNHFNTISRTFLIVTGHDDSKIRFWTYQVC